MNRLSLIEELRCLSNMSQVVVKFILHINTYTVYTCFGPQAKFGPMLHSTKNTPPQKKVHVAMVTFETHGSKN